MADLFYNDWLDDSFLEHASSLFCSKLSLSWYWTVWGTVNCTCIAVYQHELMPRLVDAAQMAIQNVLELGE